MEIETIVIIIKIIAIICFIIGVWLGDKFYKKRKKQKNEKRI